MAGDTGELSLVAYDFYWLPYDGDELDIVRQLAQRVSDAAGNWDEAVSLTDRAPLWERAENIESIPEPRGHECMAYLAFGTMEPVCGTDYAEIMLWRSHDIVAVQLLLFAEDGDADTLRGRVERLLSSPERLAGGEDRHLGRTLLENWTIDEAQMDGSDSDDAEDGAGTLDAIAGQLRLLNEDASGRRYRLITPRSREDTANAVVQWSADEQLHIFAALEIARLKVARELEEYRVAAELLQRTERHLREPSEAGPAGDASDPRSKADLLRQCTGEPRGPEARELTDRLCEMTAAQEQLGNLLSRTDDLARTIEINLENFGQVRSALMGDDGGENLLQDDLADMQHRLEQIQLDGQYRQAVAERAARSVETARTQIELLRSQAEAEVAELATLEASLITAIGTGIAIFQTVIDWEPVPLSQTQTVAGALLGAAVVFYLSRLLLGAGQSSLSWMINRAALAAVVVTAVGTLWAFLGPAIAQPSAVAAGYAAIVIIPMAVILALLHRARRCDYEPR